MVTPRTQRTAPDVVSAPSSVDWLAAQDQRDLPPVGVCRGCMRQIFQDTAHLRRISRAGPHNRHGSQYARASAGHPDWCADCINWLHHHPGQPLHESSGHAGRPLPARLIEGVGYRWRRWAACRDAPWCLFDVPDIRLITPVTIPESTRAAAVVYCEVCPVRQECRDEADAHEYEGLYGGIFRYTAIGRGYRRIDLLDRLDDEPPP